MGFFSKNRTDGETYDGQGAERKGLIDVIKYNGLPDEIVWKFPYENLSTASQLIVNQSQEAVFVRGGAVCDIFGPGTHTLSANNIPVLQKLINLPFGGRTPFTAEVWYVSKTVRRNLKFGTPAPVTVHDPLYRVPIPMRAFGEYGIRVSDSAMLLGELVGTLHIFDTKSIIEQFKSMIAQELNGCFGKFSREKQISLIDLPQYSSEISKYLHDILAQEFKQYGLSLENFNIANINYKDDDPNVQEVLSAQSRAMRRNIEGYTYQQERQFDVMETAAGNEGSAQSAFMGAGIGLGMGAGIGASFGQQMNNISGQTMGAQTPPPPPVETAYHVIINGVQQGPVGMSALQNMVAQGSVTRETYVWKNGMPQWSKAGDCPELKALFGAAPPPPPPFAQ